MDATEQVEGLSVQIACVCIPFRSDISKDSSTSYLFVFLNVSPALSILICCLTTSLRKHTQGQIKFPKVKEDPV